MELTAFPLGVAQRLKFYVHRLIDPRNGETFYVGKGSGDRVFQHALNAVAATEEEDSSDLKSQRIVDIERSGLQVMHVVHRHGIETEATAYEIESALMDAYAGLTNKAAGHHSHEFGVAHVTELVTAYSAEPFVAREPLIAISINKSALEEGKSTYDAVRGVWVINRARAEGSKLVLAHIQGLVVGAYRPTRWLPGLREHFPWLNDDNEKRLGFEGVEADAATKALYLRKWVPDQYRKPGAANPVRFINEVS